jgi:hypothetical protein
MRRYRLGEALNVFKKHIENYFTPLNLSVL